MLVKKTKHMVEVFLCIKKENAIVTLYQTTEKLPSINGLSFYTARLSS